MENGTENTRTPDCIVNSSIKKSSDVYCITGNKNKMKFCESNPYQTKFSDSDGSSETEEKTRVVTFFSSLLKKTRAFGSRKRPHSLIVFRESSKQKTKLSFLDRLKSFKRLKSMELFRLQFTRNLRRKTSKIWSREKRGMPNGSSTCKQTLDEGTFRHTYAGDLQDFDTAGDSNLITCALENISIEDEQPVNKSWKNIQQYFKSSNRKTFDPNVTSCYNTITIFPEDTRNKYTKISQEYKGNRRNDVLSYLKKMSGKKKLTEKNADHNCRNSDGLVDSASIKQEYDLSYSEKSSRIRDRKHLLKAIDFSKVIKVINRESKQNNFIDTYTQFEETPQPSPSNRNRDLPLIPIIPETENGKAISLSQSSLTPDSGLCNSLSQSSLSESLQMHEITRAEISVQRCNSELLDSFTPISSLCDEWKIPEVMPTCQATSDGIHCQEAPGLQSVAAEPKAEIQSNDVSAKEQVDGLSHDEETRESEETKSNQTNADCEKLPRPVSDCGLFSDWQSIILNDDSPNIAEFSMKPKVPADSTGAESGICSNSSPAMKIRLRNKRARQRPFSVIDGASLAGHCEKTINLHQPATCRPPPPHHVPPFRAVSHSIRPLHLSQSTPIGLDQVGWKSQILAVTANDASRLEMTRIHESSTSIKDYGFCHDSGRPLKHGAEQLLVNKIVAARREHNLDNGDP